MAKFIKYWLPVLIWAAVIFFLSAQPDLKSSLPGKYDFILRKLAHISEYAVLFLLVSRAFLGHSFSTKKALFLAFLFSVVYAISDEYHQTFIHGRVGAITDVLIDSIGIFAATFWRWWRFR